MSIDLATGELPPTFLRRLVEAITTEDLLGGVSYSPPQGSLALRSIFTDRLAALASSPDDAIVTHGALGGLDLLLRCWARPGRRFWMHDPGYREARSIALRHDLRPAALPRGAEALSSWEPDPFDVVYVVPSCNNPDGISMTASERVALAGAVAGAGTRLVEDDVYRPIARHPGPSVSALVGEAPGGARAARLVSFSKTLLPGARCCVLEGTSGVVEELALAKPDFGTGPLASAIVAVLIERHWAEAVAGVSRRLADARAAAQEIFEDGDIVLTVPDDGYFLWVPVRAPIEGAVLGTDVLVAGGRPFQLDPTSQPFARLSLSWEPPDRIAAGCRELLCHVDRDRCARLQTEEI